MGFDGRGLLGAEAVQQQVAARVGARLCVAQQPLRNQSLHQRVVPAAVQQLRATKVVQPRIARVREMAATAGHEQKGR